MNREKMRVNVHPVRIEGRGGTKVSGVQAWDT